MFIQLMSFVNFLKLMKHNVQNQECISQNGEAILILMLGNDEVNETKLR